MSIRNKKIKGFTFIEILIVVSIIAIISSIVFVMLNNAKDRASRAAALSIAKSALSELVNCQNDNGYADSDAIAAGQIICCNASGSGCNLAGAKPGHTAPWPAFTQGWGYGTGSDTPSGTVTPDGNYVFKITKSGQTTISCSLASSDCQ